MKKTCLFVLTAMMAVVILLTSCHKNVIDETTDVVDVIEESDSNYSYARINTDVTSHEILSATTKTGETITWYGDKKDDGTAQNLRNIEYSTIDGIDNIIGFDETGRLVSITNNVGASIEFEWLSMTSAVVKAYSQSDNIYISTIIDFAGNDECDSIAAKRNSIRANKPLELEIIDDKGICNARDSYDPDDYPEYQEVDLWIQQCGSDYAAKNYLILKDASNGCVIGKILENECLYKGFYIYQLPLSSYPSSATNQEICASIDAVLRNMEEWVSGALVDTAPIIAAINSAAFMSGIGTVPAIITDAVIFAITAMNCGVSIFNSFGGVAGLMMMYNSEWYYKEYIISNIDIVPVAYTQSTTFVGEKYTLSPDDGDEIIMFEIQGEPVIDSFVLNPSNPGSGVNYTATADFHCIPDDSIITISIQGTDGYSDSISKTISGSGSAVLHVPGAASGVCDVCTVTIVTPLGEEFTMQASLVFGN